jgi:hypothetical protein
MIAMRVHTDLEGSSTLLESPSIYAGDVRSISASLRLGQSLALSSGVSFKTGFSSIGERL